MSQDGERPLKAGMRIAKRSSASSDRTTGRVNACSQFIRRVVVAIDVAPDTGASQQVHVVGAGQQADVIDLRDARHEALNRARDEVLGVAAAERVIERAVDLRRIDIAGASPLASTALAAAALMDRVDQRVDVALAAARPCSPGRRARRSTSATPMPSCVSSTVTALRGRMSKPAIQGCGVARVQRVQDERRQGEVVHPVDLAGDVDLIVW